MWFAFGIVTFVVALVITLRDRLTADWGGTIQTLASKPPNSGLPYHFKASERGLNVWVGVDAPDHVRFGAHLERPLDRLLKWLRISYEIQLNDAAFDRQVYLEADAQGVAQWLSGSQEIRLTLLGILQNVGIYHGHNAAVRCTRGRLWVEFCCVKSDRNKAVASVVPRLHKLSASLRERQFPPEEFRDPFVRRAAVLLSISTASVLLGMYGAARSMYHTDILQAGLLFQTSILAGLCLFVPFICLIVRALGRTSRTGIVLLEATLLGAPGFILSAYALTREANMAFDFEPARAYQIADVRVSRHGSTVRRKRDYFMLHTLDWPSDLPRPESETGIPGAWQRFTGKARNQFMSDALHWPTALNRPKQRIEITREEYRALAGKTSAVLLIRPGALGYDWIERVIPAPTAE